MPKDLKESYGDRLRQRAAEEGMPDFVDQIGDETVATTTEDLVEHLTRVGHPALTMDALF
jgi:acetyl-CoA synthase